MDRSLDDIENMVDGWERTAQEKAARYQAMSAQAQQISVQAEAAGGAVKVTVGANGIPSDVTMTAKVRQLSPEQISAAVMTAMRQAQAMYAQRLGEVTAETIGDDATSAT